MRLTFQHTLSDILELNRAAREQRIKAWLCILLGAGHFFLGVLMAVFGDSRPDPTPVFLVACMLLLIGVCATWLAGLGGWIFWARRTPYELEVGPEGIVFLEREGPLVLGWESFSRWYETATLLVLVAHGDGLAIPRRCSSPAEWGKVLALVRTKLGDPARW
jgi:hypothetical protein